MFSKVNVTTVLLLVKQHLKEILVIWLVVLIGSISIYPFPFDHSTATTVYLPRDVLEPLHPDDMMKSTDKNPLSDDAYLMEFKDANGSWSSDVVLPLGNLGNTRLIYPNPYNFTISNKQFSKPLNLNPLIEDHYIVINMTLKLPQNYDYGYFYLYFKDGTTTGGVKYKYTLRLQTLTNKGDELNLTFFENFSNRVGYSLSSMSWISRSSLFSKDGFIIRSSTFPYEKVTMKIPLAGNTVSFIFWAILSDAVDNALPYDYWNQTPQVPYYMVEYEVGVSLSLIFPPKKSSIIILLWQSSPILVILTLGSALGFGIFYLINKKKKKRIEEEY